MTASAWWDDPDGVVRTLRGTLDQLKADGLKVKELRLPCSQTRVDAMAPLIDADLIAAPGLGVMEFVDKDGVVICRQVPPSTLWAFDPSPPPT